MLTSFLLFSLKKGEWESEKSLAVLDKKFLKDDPNLWRMIYEIMVFIIRVSAEYVVFDWYAWSLQASFFFS